ncbi:uncharacterized protein B0T15DRAFT_47069 [Chaetomium strumarium]|uniref:Uncharacterized protein n=1 Tax=Chaetomium strumarium TaxID=1170767 RepID=A0AAJ0M6I1_9PEZI|nr:hypothetical protein B0T15DRAFT_47069 [Chaetomium strumarium]
MAAVSEAKARELISQLQRVQQDEIRILQELYGIRGDQEARVEDPPEVSDATSDDDGSGRDVDDNRQDSDEKSEQDNDEKGEQDNDEGSEQHSGIVCTPPGWRAPWRAAWTDELLAQRIHTHQVRGGGSIAENDLTDPAAKFIHDNVLRSLRDFSFRRGIPFKNGDDAFCVIDFDREGGTTLETSDNTPDSRQALFRGRSASSSYTRHMCATHSSTHLVSCCSSSCAYRTVKICQSLYPKCSSNYFSHRRRLLHICCTEETP